MFCKCASNAVITVSVYRSFNTAPLTLLNRQKSSNRTTSWVALKKQLQFFSPPPTTSSQYAAYCSGRQGTLEDGQKTDDVKDSGEGSAEGYEKFIAIGTKSADALTDNEMKLIESIMKLPSKSRNATLHQLIKYSRDTDVSMLNESSNTSHTSSTLPFDGSAFPPVNEQKTPATSSPTPDTVAAQYLSTESADAIFNSLDMNRDGHVSQREFRTWYNLHFKSSQATPTTQNIQDNRKSNEPRDSTETTVLRTDQIPHPPTSVYSASDDVSVTSSHLHDSADDADPDIIASRKHRHAFLPLTKYQTFIVLLRSSIPYIGFGIMDNCLMLLFGEMIDRYVGTLLGLSTLAAAGFGNTISCASGVITGGFVERAVYRLGLPNAKLTPLQADSKTVKNLHLSGSVIGICFGCLLGMFPLLLLPSSVKEGDIDEVVYRTESESGNIAKSGNC